MFRIYSRRLQASAVAGSASSSSQLPSSSPPLPPNSSAPTSPSSATAERAQMMMQMRKSPFGIGDKRTLHSHLLSEHAMTLKAAREEAAYRQRTLEERGVFDAAAREEAQQIKEEQAKTSEGKKHHEVRWVYFTATMGYLVGHIAAHQLFEVDDMRLPYDPVNGFINDLARQKVVFSKLDVLVHSRVVGQVLAAKDPRKPSALHAH